MELVGGALFESTGGNGVLLADFFFRPLFLVAVNSVLPSRILVQDDANSSEEAAALEDRVACCAVDAEADFFLFESNLPVKPSSNRFGVVLMI